jgi:D-serine deaminase-like pyridoxal phosphate-dependent protein
MSEVATDILLAYPPVGALRARRIASLPDDVRLTVALDSATAANDLAAAARASDRPISVYVELDLGMHRVGLPVVDDAIALARRIRDAKPLAFGGIAFYPGHIREPVDSQDAKLDALRTGLGEALDRFERAGLTPPAVSGGSTPTMWRTHEIPGVTEFRPGTYIFNDRTTAEIGACAWEDCALTVLATVVSTAVAGQAVIDAGSKALGREPARGAGGDDGFGSLVEHPEVVVKGMSEEHGLLDLSRTSWHPVVGERVRVIPNHVCIVVHLNDVVFGVRSGTVETSWPVAARGRGYPISLGAEATA